MDTKVANRYVDILTYAIDKVYRKNKNNTFDRNDIFNNISEITDKTYKNSMQWFVSRNIFEKVGDTYGTKYKLHNDFKFKLSKSKEKIKSQCRFIIGQLSTFSNLLWNESAVLYEDIVLNTDRFDFIPLIKEQSIKDTVSEVILNEYNEDNKGVYPYEILQTMILTKSLCTIHIKNSQLNIKMKSVKLKKIIFKTDTITLQFDNSKFDIDSLGHIKLIEIPKTKGLRDRVDKSLGLLQRYDNKSVKPLIDLLTACQNYEDLTF